jgi:hypothetical protein
LRPERVALVALEGGFMATASTRIALVSLLSAGLGACVPNARTFPPVGPGERIVIANGDVESRSLKVPPGHFPRPGECRLWFPSRPPGQQPRAGSCVGLARIAPAGTMILYRPTHEKKVIYARVIDPKRDGVIIVTRVYTDRGTYLREDKQR